jgi:hypothetical protein
MAGHGSSVNSEVPAAVRTAGAAQVGWAKRHVPELASCAGRTEHGSTIHDKDSANSDLDGQVQSNCHAVCGASQCLGKSGEGGIVPNCQGELDRADASEDAEIDITPLQVTRLYQQAALDTARNRYRHGAQPWAEFAMQVCQRQGDLVKQSSGVAASVMVVDGRGSESAADLRCRDPPGLVCDLDHGHERASGVWHQDPGRPPTDACDAGGSLVEQPCRPKPSHDLGGGPAAQTEPAGCLCPRDARVLMSTAQQRQSALSPHCAGELPPWSRHRSFPSACRVARTVAWTPV